MHQVTGNGIEVIVFDMGGVLAELGDPVSTFGFNGTKSEFWERWLGSSAVRAYEAGNIEASCFEKQVVDELEIRVSPAEFSERLNAWIEPPTEEVTDLLLYLSSLYRLGLLSNTNAAHWDIVCQTSQFSDLFDELFLSFETHLLKPDAGAFKQVPYAFACAPENILFIDDNQLNVDAATEVGLHAVRAEGISDLRAVLGELGI